MTMNTFGNLSSSHLYIFILEVWNENIFCYCCHFDGYEGFVGCLAACGVLELFGLEFD